MTDFIGRCLSWSRPHANKQISPLPFKCDASLSSPIPIPRRQSIHPPPRSPTRGQDSPDLVFNFDFSISPGESDATTPVLLQQRGAGVRRPRQNAAYVSLAPLDTSGQNVAHPYTHEPFLYPIPKLPFCNEESIHVPKSGFEVNRAAAEAQFPSSPLPANIHSASWALSSISSLHSPNPSYPPSTDVSCQVDTENDSLLASAFQESAIHSIASSPVNDTDIENSPSTQRRTPSPPSRLMRSDMHDQRSVLYRRLASHRTAAAAPVVSLSIAEAERSDRRGGTSRGGRSQSPGSGRVPPWTRRSSSASARLGLEKFRESSQQMGTVIGRGAGRVINMFEYRYAGARSLVSDEDIQGSLEKDQVGRLRGAGRGGMPDEKGEKGCNNAMLKRGRARVRMSTQGSPPSAA